MRDHFKKLKKQNIRIIDEKYALADYGPIDLSVFNKNLAIIDVSICANLDSFIQNELKKINAKIGYGGYLEQRSIYKRSVDFKPEMDPHQERDIHLGIDIWASAGTAVNALMEGEVHSFSNNVGFGNYGPTIILKHQIEDFVFYSLYGHLSINSLQGIRKGQCIKAGEPFAKLGDTGVNGDYPPHLHFQLIKEIGDWVGDYPGVCSKQDLQFYQENCPDPKWVLQF